MKNVFLFFTCKTSFFVNKILFSIILTNVAIFRCLCLEHLSRETSTKLHKWPFFTWLLYVFAFLSTGTKTKRAFLYFRKNMSHSFYPLFHLHYFPCFFSSLRILFYFVPCHIISTGVSVKLVWKNELFCAAKRVGTLFCVTPRWKFQSEFSFYFTVMHLLALLYSF